MFHKLYLLMIVILVITLTVTFKCKNPTATTIDKTHLQGQIATNTLPGEKIISQKEQLIRQSETARQTELRRNANGELELYKKIKGKNVKIKNPTIVEVVFVTYKGSEGITIYTKKNRSEKAHKTKSYVAGYGIAGSQSLEQTCQQIKLLKAQSPPPEVLRELEIMLARCP